jgi:hypothetical protein
MEYGHGAGSATGPELLAKNAKITRRDWRMIETARVDSRSRFRDQWDRPG